MTERMFERWIFSKGTRRGLPRLGVAAWLLALAGLANACLSDVPLPDCVERQVPCLDSDGGAGDESVGGSPASSAGGAAVGGAARGGIGPAGAGGSSGLETAGEGGLAGNDGLSGEGGGPLVVPPQQLVAPCAGSSYQGSLGISGGVPPYRWELTPAVAGWSIAVDPKLPQRAIVKSSAASAGKTSLTLAVTDAIGHHKKLTITLEARSSCWFAYTALETDGPRLRLLDPLAEVAAPAVLENNVGVFDFRFSPDGRYLVYRFGADADHPHGRHLALVQLDTLHEQVLSFAEDAVTAFAWSPDSKHLAVAFNSQKSRYLTALVLPAIGSDASPTELSPRAAFVESDLYWAGNEFVAFHAELLPGADDNPTHLRSALYARLGVTGFGAQQISENTFDADVTLRPTDRGFYMITASDPFTTFTLLGDAPQTAYHSFVDLVAPSGRYSADLFDGPLTLRFDDGGYFSPSVATAKDDETCPMLLAWAKGSERLACVADVANEGANTTHGELHFFDLDAEHASLKMQTLPEFCEEDSSVVEPASCASLLHGYAYGTLEATGAARAFSASGHWFAFTRVLPQATYLYWADLNRQPVALTRAVYVATEDAASATQLGFSPDERLLVLGRGHTLLLQDLTKVSDIKTMPGSLTLQSVCSEDFPKAPDSYCGNTDHTAPLEWAPDSTTLAYRTSATLRVTDLSYFPTSIEFLLAAPECGPSCSGQFAFQPNHAQN